MNQLTDEQIREWRPIIVDRVVSLIGNETPDWEDVTQDIFLSMVREIEIFRDESDIRTMLYVVTMRRYYDYLRDKYRRKAIDCYLQFMRVPHRSPRRMRGPETRIDKINLLLKSTKLDIEKKRLLEVVKKTLLSGRMN